MTIKTYLASEEETLAFAGALAKAVPEGCYLYLQGTLGAGKTTFARGFLRGLGYQDKVKSPTYTLIEPYEVAGRTIYHCDFYRIKDIRELEELGIGEYFLPEAICLIEWPEAGAPLLPTPDLVVSLALKDEGREISLEAGTPRGEAILANF